MGFSEWWESTWYADKFTAKKALHHIKKEYKQSSGEYDFETIFIDLVNEEIQKQGRLLALDEIEKIAYRARIQARHKTRNEERRTIQSLEEIRAEESIQRTTGTLPKEIYDRLDKQLQSIKTTTSLLLSQGELGSVRNLKLKTAQETIPKIIKELMIKAKAKGIKKETQRAVQLEITRWQELTQKINARLEKKITALEFKDYVNSFDKSFQEKRNEATA